MASCRLPLGHFRERLGCGTRRNLRQRQRICQRPCHGPSWRIPSADDGGRPPPADLNGQVSVSLAVSLYLDAKT
jgi:hypothetical protein